MILEKDIEKRLKIEVDRLGGHCLKFISPSWAGIPDRLVLMPGGRIAFVELKAPDKKPRKLQSKRAEQLIKLGFNVYTIDNYEDCEKIALKIRG